MSRTLIWRLLFPTLCFTLAWAQHPPLDIGSRLELFVDGYLIDSMEGVNLMLQEPQSAGKVLSFDKPWEGSTSAYHTVFKDGDLYRMYYRGSSLAGVPIPSLLEPGVEIIPEHTEVACYIESRDGHTWTRPNLGLLEFEGSKENNIIWDDQSDGGHNFAPFKDGNPSASASGRYKALGESPLIFGDEIEHTVRWERTHPRATSDKPLTRIAGKPVRLRFVMKDADLYSLRFR